MTNNEIRMCLTEIRMELLAIHDSIPEQVTAPVEGLEPLVDNTPLPTPEFGTTRLLPWGLQARRDHGPEFIEGVLWIESQIGLKAEFLMPCMKFESNINPKARNPKSTASGLIQFMEFTAKKLGTTIENIRGLDALSQLSWVYRYFKQFGDDLSKWSLADVYMAILWPAAIGKPLNHRLFVDDPKKFNDSYDVNKGLDKDKDGVVTKAEAAQKVIELYDLGLKPGNYLAIP